MNKIYKVLILLLIVKLNSTKAQVSLSDSMSNVQVCYASTVNKLTFNGTTGSSGQYIEVQLPTGFSYTGIQNFSVTGGGSISYAGVFSGFHRFTLSGGSSNPTVELRFRKFASCAAGTSSFTTRDSIRYFNGSSLSAFRGTAFNGTAPSLSITSISNTPSSATVGTNVTRQYTVTNGGFGPTGDFIIVDKRSAAGQFTINTSSFVVNPSGSNYSVPGASVSTSGDSIIVRFKKALIADAGIGNSDSFFQNGESFVLSYTLTVNTCAVPTITSQLLAAWQCPGEARCNWFLVNTGISTFGPALPNIVQLTSLRRRNDCFDGTTVWRDTLVLRNNSSGAATDIQIDAGGTRNTSFRTDLPGAYFDTASFFVRIGRNGVSYKPAYTVIGSLTSSYSGCSFTGRPNHIRFTVPYLGPGDTMYIIMGQVQCNYNRSCVVNQSHADITYFNGLGINFNYKNACGNATFNGGWMDAQTYRDHYIDVTNTGPLSLSDGQTGDLSLDIGQINYISGQRLLFGNRAYREVTIVKPNVIIWDPAYSNPVYFEHPTNGIQLPYYRSTNGDTFKFRINNTHFNLGTVFHAKVKGQCDGATCSGILQYQIIFSHNPDTTYCTRENPEFCLDYPIAWASSCVVCCPKGMVNLKYEINRVNFGLGDDDNNGLPSGVLDLSQINTKRYLAGDTMEIIHKFYLKTDMTDTQWDYLRSLMKVDNVSYFSVVSDSVFVDRLTGTDSVFNMTPTTLGTDRFNTDLSFMPPFLQGDTVTIKLKLRRTLYEYSQNVRSFNSQVDGGASNDNFTTNFACGAIIDKAEFYGSGTFGYISHVGTVNGCQPYDFYPLFYHFIGPGSGTYSNYRFPYEYRPLAYPKKLKISIPSGYTIDNVVFWNINYAGQSLATTYPQLTNVPYSYVNDTLNIDVRSFYSANGGLLISPDEGAWIQFRVRLVPTCRTTSGFNGAFSLRDSFQMLTPFTISGYDIVSRPPQLGSTLANFHPNIILSSAVPISTAYSKSVSWPLSVNNLTAFAATDNWLYIVKPSGDIIIDSLKEGSILINPDANGFYRINTINAGATRNFTVFGRSNACTFDSVIVYPGWSCGGVYPTSFSTTTCGRPGINLYVQPQPAAIQTQISALSVSPINPFNGASSGYGSNAVSMCNNFPLQMEIQSTQPGTIYDVKQFAILPYNNGATGLDLIFDSITVEYPIGTTPRLASHQGRALMASTISSGSMEFDLQKLDTANFGLNQGLPGTGLGTNSTRRVIIRWKMKTNCNIISGDQWNAEQRALSACGAVAQGNSTLTSGFAIDIQGVTKPYIVLVNTQAKCAGCSPTNADTTIIRLQKIGAVAPTSTDSVFIKVPSNIQIGNIYCSGVNCPGGVSGNISNINQSVSAGVRTAVFQVPSQFDLNNDTMLLFVQVYDNNKGGCASNLQMQSGVRIPATLVCNGTPCPASNANLGVSVNQFTAEKAVLSFVAYDFYGVQHNRYRLFTSIQNSNTVAKVNPGLTLRTFVDLNSNNAYDPGVDDLMETTSYSVAINPSSIVNKVDTFGTFYPPTSPYNAFTIIDTSFSSANCFCAASAMSPLIPLPINFLKIEAKNLNNKVSKVTWVVEENNSVESYDLYRKSENESSFTKVASISANGKNGILTYQHIDDISTLSNGKIFYYVQTNTNEKTEVVYITKNHLENKVFNIIPNPATTEINVISSSLSTTENTVISILDMSGKKVLEINTNKSENTIQLTNLNAGIYNIVIQNGETIETQKLVIIK